ncbi:hypothetical protein [Pelomonas cellulosilytica]|uniref:Transmembrane protein n=1 Tax=Pelomonas cellulosilytica TaxID=2906762 RepID=A0ABS8XM41_9BURK|nr:hypothetical protein [Pelomonas sp. P8]MCE4553847.1 hypothetical protein [Pelomonas sp. P8]
MNTTTSGAVHAPSSRPRTAHWMRQGHRWLSLVFTAAVLLNFAVRAVQPGEPAAWITYAPLPPLFLQLVSGLYLFVQPYLRRRVGRP